MMRKAIVAVVVMVAVVAFVGTGWWAAGQVAAPVGEIPAGPTTTLYEVRVGTVGSALDLAVTARWVPEAEVVADRSGVLTERTVVDGAVVEDGLMVGSLNLDPIVVGEGSIPLFRDLTRGANGQDVEELQSFLVRQGFYEGVVDGKWGRATTSAVKLWEEDLGLERTGSVPLGRLAFTSRLPARIVWGVSVGDRVTAGQGLLAILGDEPIFSARLRRAQLVNLPPDVDIVIVGPTGEEWTASLGVVDDLGGDEVEVALVNPSGMCGGRCETIPVAGTIRLSGKAVVIPDTTGPVVPAAAIRVSPDGVASVAMEDGSVRVVVIVASADGLAVLDGVVPGERVVLAGFEDAGDQNTGEGP